MPHTGDLIIAGISTSGTTAAATDGPEATGTVCIYVDDGCKSYVYMKEVCGKLSIHLYGKSKNNTYNNSDLQFTIDMNKKTEIT